MAYDPSKMSLLGAGGNAALWSYETTDAKATVIVPGYFVPIWQQLDPGDRIHCKAGAVFFDIVVVSAALGSVPLLTLANYA